MNKGVPGLDSADREFACVLERVCLTELLGHLSKQALLLRHRLRGADVPSLSV